MIEFDIAVIGGGPGGYAAAIRGAQCGAKVCLVEAAEVGGTCLNRGCIPTKALYSSAHLLQQLRGAAEHGIMLSSPQVDFSRMQARKDAVVAKLVGGIEQLLKGWGIEIFRGQGMLEGPGRVKIRRDDVIGHIRAKTIILATGSLPVKPHSLAIDGKNVLTSDEILVMKELPESLLIIGGGYIGCEFAAIFAALGTRVTLVEQLPQLLGNSDRQAVREVEKSFAELGVKIVLGTSVENLTTAESGVAARLSDGQSLQVGKVLVAVGRAPNSAGLGLEQAGVTTTNGAVVVDAGMRTSVPGVFAIGDLTGGVQLAHVASHQAEVAVANALGGNEQVDLRVLPSVVFTFPELAQVGLTEEQCKADGLAIEVGRFSLQASSKALCDGEARGQVKVVAARDDGRILGVTVVGAGAASLIAEAAVAMQQGLSAQQLSEVIHAHPTLPEALMEAAEDVAGLAVHKMSRKRRGDAPAPQ